MYTKSPDTHSICRGPAAYLHPASVLHRCTRNLLTRAAFAEFKPFTCTLRAFQIDAQEIPSQAQHLQRSAVYLHPVSATHRCTRNALTGTAFADFQLFTCTQPAFYIDVHEILLTGTAFSEVQLFTCTQPAFHIISHEIPDRHRVQPFPCTQPAFQIDVHKIA